MDMEMEVRAVKGRREFLESLPVEIWNKIFELGIEKSNFSIKDISSLLLTCKLFNHLWSQDSLWSLLVTLDFPQFAHDAASVHYSSSSQKMLYKYGLARHCKRKFVFFDRHLARLNSQIHILVDRIQHLTARVQKGNAWLEMLTARFRTGIDQGVEATEGGQEHLRYVYSLEKKIDDIVEVQQSKLAKIDKQESRLQSCVKRQELCQKEVTTLLSCLGALCTGSHPIEVAHLSLEGDEVDEEEEDDVDEDDDDLDELGYDLDELGYAIIQHVDDQHEDNNLFNEPLEEEENVEVAGVERG